MMKVIYQDSKDLHILSAVAYGNSEDGKLYADTEFTAQVDLTEAEEAFAKNMLVVKMDDKLFKPVALIDGNVVVLDLSSGSVLPVQLAVKAE